MPDPIPATTDFDITTGTTSDAVRTVLDAKYTDAGSWATWAATMLQQDIADINNLLGTDTAGANLSALQAAIDAIALYAPGGALTYTAPAAPTYDVIPTYVAPTLGTLLAVPAVDAIVIGAAPATAVTFTNSAFSDTLLDSLRAKLAADITNFSTGLGDAEAGLIDRETARQNTIRSAAYTEITTQYSSRGFDLPPGALLAKQTEMNNESAIRLADSSTGILVESARLAQAWNQSALTASVQTLDLLSRVFDSRIMRDFEAAKTAVMLAVEGFKQEVSVALAKAELNKTAITATIAANEGTVKVFTSELVGQVEPIKALAEVNQSKAAVYGQEVEASVANLNAQILPEELKLKGVTANAQIAGTKADIAAKQAMIVIDAAARQLVLEVSTLQGLAQSASQMVASALNSVNVSTSLGYDAKTSMSRGDSKEVKVFYEATPGVLPPLT